MKLMPADWPGFFDQLELWGELSIAARKAFLDGARPGLSFEPSPMNPAIDELRVAGLLEDSTGSGRISISAEAVAFHHVLKAMERHPIFDSPGLAELCAYLGDHYSPLERSQLHESLALLPGDLTRVAGLVSSTEWLQGGLDRAVRPGEEQERKAARVILEFLTEQRERVAIRDLPEYLPQVSRELLPLALRQGVQRAVFFLGLRRSDLEPLVGVWAPAVRRLRRMAVILAPRPVAARQRFWHPFLVEDMAALLLMASIRPIPLRRGDERPFARFVEETGQMLLSLPDWLEGFTGLSLEARVELALQALGLCGLLSATGPGEDGPANPADFRARGGSGISLCITAEGQSWRRRTLEERRDQVVRSFAARAPARLFDLLEEEWTSSDEARDQIAPLLVQAFSSVPLATFVRFAEFAEYQAAIGAPTTLQAARSDPEGVDSAGPGAAAAAVPGPASEEAIEELWKSFLGIFLGHCLLGVGGCEAGLDQEGRPCFRMTGIGRLLLGLPHVGWEADGDGTGGPGNDAAPLVVQPNFEVVFLSPSPGSEARLGLFCDRLGRGIGVLFRLSRDSVRRAAVSGMAAKEVLAILSQGSRSPLPTNVEHEIRDWMRSTDAEP